MQTPSVKVITHTALSLIFGVAAFLAKDTRWLGWLPPKLQPLAPALGILVAFLASYYVSETNPPASGRGQ
jgi:hypothetical protein